jgi:hypothetical protein
MASTDGSDLEASVVRILDAHDATCGAGFLVDSSGLVVTCTHVLERASCARGGTVRVRFRAQTMRAQIDDDLWRDRDEGDLAFLWLHDQPEGMRAARLAPSRTSARHNFRTYGFTHADARKGSWGYGAIGHARDAAGTEIQLYESKEITSGYSGGPLFDEEIRCVVGVVASIPLPSEDGRQVSTSFAIPSEQVFAVATHLKPSEECPYRDLAAFTELDAPWWHGRASVLANVTDKLARDPRCIAILGPSGCGKSSLLHAGVVPRLRQLHTQARDRPWQIAVERAARDPYGWTADSPPPLPDGVRHVLVLDQLEDVFVNLTDGARSNFLSHLSDAIKNRPGFLAIVAMRDDYYSQLQAQAPRLLQDLVQVSAALTREELIDIVNAPAEKAHLQFEPTSLPEIIADHVIERFPGTEAGTARSTSLPLLQVALTQLWQERTNGTMHHGRYKQAGITTAIAARIEKELAALDPGLLPTLDRVLIELIEPGVDAMPDKGRRRDRQELRDELGKSFPRLDEVIDWMAGARVVVTARDEGTKRVFIELIHDSLLVSWDRLRELRGRLRRFVAWHEKAMQIAQQGRLLQPDEMVDAERWQRNDAPALAASVVRLLRDSRRALRRRRRRVHLVAALVVAVVVGAALMAVTMLRQRREQEERRKREEKLGRTAAALEILAQANRHSPSEAFAALAAASHLAPDNREIFGATVARLFDDRHRVFERVLAKGITAVAVGHDGVRAHGSVDGTIWIDSTKHSWRAFSEGVRSLSWSPDGRSLLATSKEGDLARIEISEPDPVGSERVQGLMAAAFLPDGRVVARVENRVVVLERNGGTWRETATVHEAPPGHAASSRDNSMSFAVGRDGTIALVIDGTLHVHAGALTRTAELPGPDDCDDSGDAPVMGIALDETSSRAALNLGRRIVVFDWSTGAFSIVHDQIAAQEAWITGLTVTTIGELVSAHRANEKTELFVWSFGARCDDRHRFDRSGPAAPCLHDRLGVEDGYVFALAAGLDGDIISGSIDFDSDSETGTLAVWSPASAGPAITTLRDDNGIVVLRNGDIATQWPAITVRDALGNERYRAPAGNTHDVEQLSPDQIISLASGDARSVLMLHDLRTGTRTPLLEEDWLRDAAVFEDEIVVAGAEAVYLVDPEARTVERISEEGARRIVVGAGWFAAVGDDYKVMIRRGASWSEVRMPASTLAAGRELLAVGVNNTIVLAQAPSFLTINQLGACDDVDMLAVSPDDRWIAAVCDPLVAGTLVLWDANGVRATELPLGDPQTPVEGVEFVGDSQHLAIRMKDQLILLDLTEKALLERACFLLRRNDDATPGSPDTVRLVEPFVLCK